MNDDLPRVGDTVSWLIAIVTVDGRRIPYQVWGTVVEPVISDVWITAIPNIANGPAGWIEYALRRDQIVALIRKK